MAADDYGSDQADTLSTVSGTIIVASGDDIVVEISRGDDQVTVMYNGTQIGLASLPNFKPIIVSLRKFSNQPENTLDIYVFNNTLNVSNRGLEILGKNKYGITYKIYVTDFAGNPRPLAPITDIDFSYDSTAGGILWSASYAVRMK